MMRRFRLAVTLLLAAGAPAHPDWHAREEPIMGTRIAVEAWHEDAAEAERAIEAVVDQRVDAAHLGRRTSREASSPVSTARRPPAR